MNEWHTKNVEDLTRTGGGPALAKPFDELSAAFQNWYSIFNGDTADDSVLGVTTSVGPMQTNSRFVIMQLSTYVL